MVLSEWWPDDEADVYRAHSKLVGPECIAKDDVRGLGPRRVTSARGTTGNHPTLPATSGH